MQGRSCSWLAWPWWTRHSNPGPNPDTLAPYSNLSPHPRPEPEPDPNPEQVDEAGVTLLDELVQPRRPVTDYNTRYSGITAGLLATATLTAAEARGRVLALARGGSGAGDARAGAEGAEGGEGGGEAENCFLVGHSLENDLRSLELAWPRVLDTALLYPLKHRLEGPPAKARCLPPTYPLPAYPPPNAYHWLTPAKAALRTLALRFLGRPIQQGGEAGHDPSEDAVAALQLAQLKLTRGHAFGLPGDGPTSPHEPLHAVLHREGWRCVAIDRTAAQLGALHAAHAAPPAAAAAATSAAGSAAAATAAAATVAAAEPPLVPRLLPCVSDARAARRAVRHAAGARPFVWLALRGAEEARATTARQPQQRTHSTHAARMQHTMRRTCSTPAVGVQSPPPARACMAAVL